MSRSEKLERREKPFEGTSVYFSNSIRGDMGKSEDIGKELVSYMIENGADVLSENVAYLKPEEGLPIFERRTGIDLTKLKDPVEYARTIRRVDMEWVDNATHLVAVVNGASYGVGMEIQRAIDKPKMGLNKTPILCLAHEESLSGLSSMVRGIDPEKEGVSFDLVIYSSLEEARTEISDFLAKYK